MCEAKRYDEAISLFNYFFNECRVIPNTLSCNLIMKAFCDQECIDHALDMFRHIFFLGGRRLGPGIESSRILTKALVDAKRIDEAFGVVLFTTPLDTIVLDILLRGLLDEGRYIEANRIFTIWKEPCGDDRNAATTIFNISFMEYWFKQDKDKEAMEIYSTLDKDQLVKPFVGNRALKVLMEHGEEEEAWDLFTKMIEICDAETVDIMWKLISERNVPFYWFRKTCYKTILGRHLCEQGNNSEAAEILAEMSFDQGEELMVTPHVSTFRAMIKGFVKAGRFDYADKMLECLKFTNFSKLAY